MSEHTEGPWEWIGTNINPKGFCYLSGKNHVVGASLDGFTENSANARLIAAAPELLEALEECTRELKAHETICEIIRQEKMPHSKPFEPSQAMNKAVKILKKVYGN